MPRQNWIAIVIKFTISHHNYFLIALVIILLRAARILIYSQTFFTWDEKLYQIFVIKNIKFLQLPKN